MERSNGQSPWGVIGASVQGPYHKNKGQPNEDAIGWYQVKPGKLPIILSVADGVGDETCFRSGRGSRFAIEASIESCRKYIRKIQYWHEEQLRHRLLDDIVERWNQKISDDLRNNPFSPEEELVSTKHARHVVSNIPDAGGIDQSKFIRSYPYSTTLNTVIVTRTAIIALQVGDGDIVSVQEDGSTTEIFQHGTECGVIPLSDPNVQDFCNIYRKSMDEARPLILYVSSDGYSDGYDHKSKGKPSFNEIIAFEFHSKIQDFPLAEIQEALPSLLEELSQGSYDDLSLGIIIGPLEKIRQTSLKLKQLSDQIQEGAEKDSNEPDVTPVSALPEGEERKAENKLVPSAEITGIETGSETHQE
jgi:serine/threonine protein phosphatase PrpC